MITRSSNPYHQSLNLTKQLWRLQTIRCSSTTAYASTKGRGHDAPFRLAVIGSGPAGFYTAYRAMGKLPHAKVDMYEKLPVPFGLVRYGVAPDHPEVKYCQQKFTEIASSPNFTFIGNVSIGDIQSNGTSTKDHCRVELSSLMRNYDSILFAYGASEDKTLGIPGESTLKGIYSAREFVGWYNGLPDCTDLKPNLSRGDEAIVIGQGNVALDVARMLLEDIDVLKKTDITEQALAHLSESRIRRVHVVGRRGPMQGAFTIKEVRELMKLSRTGFHPIPRSLIPEDIKTLPRPSKRVAEVLLKGSTTPLGAATKAWSLDSCLFPTHFLGCETAPTQVASTQFSRTELALPHDPRSTVRTTDEMIILPSDVVFRSVGYRSTSLAGFTEAGIQFDDRRGIIDNDGLGRVTRMVSDRGTADAVMQQIPGLYCAGWVKRGPTGVIASTMSDAFITGDALVHDWSNGIEFLQGRKDGPSAGWAGVRNEIGATADLAIHWQQWKNIDSAERELGQKRGKEREKFTRVSDMLSVLK